MSPPTATPRPVGRPDPLVRAAPPLRASRTATLLAGLGLFSIGAYTAILGPVLPDLAQRTGIRLGQTGALFTALFSAGIVTSALAGRLADRVGCRLLLCAGFAINGTALIVLPWVPSFAVLLAVGAVLGLGDSLLVVTAHVLVGRLSEGGEAAALNRLNVYFGVGAVVGPAAGAIARLAGLRAALVLTLLGLLQLAYGAIALRLVREPSRAADHTGEGSARPALLRSRRLWLLAALLLVYVGLEVGLGAWVFTYARQSAGLGGTAAALLSSGFWMALTAGRLVSPLALRRLSVTGLLVSGTLLAAMGALLLAVAGSTPPALTAGVLLAGFGFGPIWPVTFALSARLFRHADGSASGVLAMVAAAGGMVLPWLQGRVLDASGTTALIGLTFGGCVVLLALAIGVAKAARTEAPAARATR